MHGTNSQKLAISSLFVNLFVLLGRLFSVAKSSSIVAQSEAAIVAGIYLTGFILRFDHPVDHVAIQLVNFLVDPDIDKFGMSVHKLSVA